MDKEEIIKEAQKSYENNLAKWTIKMAGEHELSAFRIAVEEALQVQTQEIIKIVEGMEIDKNFSPHEKIGFFKAQSEILKKIK